MACSVRLVLRDGVLFIPASAIVDPDYRDWFGDEGKALVYRYPEGDCDCIPWPIESDWFGRLRSCLFDAMECGQLPPDCDAVELPSGEKFSIYPPPEDVMESF